MRLVASIFSPNGIYLFIESPSCLLGVCMYLECNTLFQSELSPIDAHSCRHRYALNPTKMLPNARSNHS
jgi:hypothetical protein